MLSPRICTATNLHAKGITDINTAQDAARALLPLGKSAYWLFALGILGTGSLAIPTMAGSIGYAVVAAFITGYDEQGYQVYETRTFDTITGTLASEAGCHSNMRGPELPLLCPYENMATCPLLSF